MRVAKVRPRDQSGDQDSDGYANYRDVEQSARDLTMWLGYSGIGRFETASEYVARIKEKKYFEDSEINYLQALNKWLRV